MNQPMETMSVWSDAKQKEGLILRSGGKNRFESKKTTPDFIKCGFEEE